MNAMVNEVAQGRSVVPRGALLEGQDDDQQYLTFMLGAEIFAINILSIKEIIEYGNLTIVPKMPSFILSLIHI